MTKERIMAEKRMLGDPCTKPLTVSEDMKSAATNVVITSCADRMP